MPNWLCWLEQAHLVRECLGFLVGQAQYLLHRMQRRSWLGAMQTVLLSLWVSPPATRGFPGTFMWFEDTFS